MTPDMRCIHSLKTGSLRIALLLAMTGLPATNAVAQNAAPLPILPDTLRWIDAPGGLPLQAAWMLGEEQASKPYLIRVKLAAGGRIPPHTHPDERHTTVLSSTLYVGFGATFDESTLTAIPTGAVYVAPAGVPHFLAARETPAVYQEAGVGPTGTVWVKP